MAKKLAHIKQCFHEQIRYVASLQDDELFNQAKELGVSYDLLKRVHDTGKLPELNFSAGGDATQAEAALML